MDCKEAKIQIYTNFLNGKFSEEVRQALENHVACCASCCKEMEEAKKIGRCERNFFVLPDKIDSDSTRIAENKQEPSSEVLVSKKENLNVPISRKEKVSFWCRSCSISLLVLAAIIGFSYFLLENMEHKENWGLKFFGKKTAKITEDLRKPAYPKHSQESSPSHDRFPSSIKEKRAFRLQFFFYEPNEEEKLRNELCHLSGVQVTFWQSSSSYHSPHVQADIIIEQSPEQTAEKTAQEIANQLPTNLRPVLSHGQGKELFFYRKHPMIKQ